MKQFFKTTIMSLIIVYLMFAFITLDIFWITTNKGAIRLLYLILSGYLDLMILIENHNIKNNEVEIEKTQINNK